EPPKLEPQVALSAPVTAAKTPAELSSKRMTPFPQATPPRSPVVKVLGKLAKAGAWTHMEIVPCTGRAPMLPIEMNCPEPEKLAAPSISPVVAVGPRILPFHPFAVESA